MSTCACVVRDDWRFIGNFHNMMIILHRFTYQALLEVHDAVAFKTYSSPPASPGLGNEPGTANGVGGQPIRMVGLHKQPNKPLVSYTASN